MATTLAEIRARLQASDNKPQGGNSSTGESVIYPLWNIAEGTSTKIRFLPDADNNNTFFWVERSLIRLPFSGIKGDANSRPTIVQIPCMDMYGRDTPCPILSEVRPWFKDPSLEVKGRQYWKKKSYLFQGFVRENPMTDDRAPANPIRRFIISPQIFNLVKSALMDPDLENLPTDYESGLDFTVTKGAKGGFADYSTSKWARKESSLTAAETAAIDQYGLFNLVDFLPKKPNDVELKVIKEMFEASVDGEAYDAERWGQYFKPSGFTAAPSATAAPAAKTTFSAPAAKPATTIEDDDVPFEVAAAPAPAAASVEAKPSSQRAEDILAMIRNRSKA